MNVPSAAPAQSASSQESALWRTCLSSLPRFHLAEAGVLSRRVVWDGEQVRAAPEPSPRNTAEVAKVLYALRGHGIASALDPDALIDQVVERYLPQLEYYDVAHALWADAVGDRRHLSTLWEALRERLPSSASQTMELAWTLSALCHFHSVAPTQGDVAALAHDLCRRIVRNQLPGTALFRTSGLRQGWLRRRAPAASLSSQSYAIQALALYARVFDREEPARRAEACAATLCRLQGPLGQWWRMYDVLGGRVVTAYPVHSVNQDAAMPMALDAVHRAVGHSRYQDHLARGLGWLFGENEIGTPFVDECRGVIGSAVELADGEFHVVREMYSYHPARCLHWLSSSGRIPGEHRC